MGNQSPAHLRPFDVEQVPSEALNLVNALNRLFGEVERAFANEQRFTAAAAHELRTPLSALRAQAQVAQRTGNDLSRKKALQAYRQRGPHDSPCVTTPDACTPGPKNGA